MKVATRLYLTPRRLKTFGDKTVLSRLPLRHVQGLLCFHSLANERHMYKELRLAFCCNFFRPYLDITHIRELLLSKRPPLWSSGQSLWLQIQRSRVRFPALPDFSE